MKPPVCLTTTKKKLLCSETKSPECRVSSMEKHSKKPFHSRRESTRGTKDPWESYGMCGS